MASDEIVWDIINHQHCSFKLKTTKDQTFCRNQYNLTGFCSRQNCPLANSRYATVRGDPATGRMYLYIKTVERAHLPSKWWEKIRLPTNYAKALQLIDERLVYWPKFLVHKSKQRLTRLTQVAIRTRRLEREQERLGEELVPRLAPKIKRREATRERKAEAAAKVERTIERELIERLRSGAYGDRPINVEEGIWKKVLRGLERSGEGTVEEDPDLAEDEEEAEEAEQEQEYEKEYEGARPQIEYVSDIDDSEDQEDDLGDLEDLEDWVDSDASEEGSVDDDDDDVGGPSSINSDGVGFVSGAGRKDMDDTDESPDEANEDANAKLKSALQSLKRKRPTAKLSNKPKKKVITKGPRREILYETEQPLRVLELA